MANIRLMRMESLALRELSLWIRSQSLSDKLKDVTVAEIRITNDLSYMTIYYSLLRKNNVDSYQEELEKFKGQIRTYLASKIKARKMPELIFKYDTSLDYGNHIDEILNKINK